MIASINELFLAVALSLDPDRNKHYSLVKSFLVCISLMVEYYASRISPLIVYLEGIFYSLGNFLTFKIMSATSLDLHLLKGNPLLNIRVPIFTSIFSVIFINRELCALETTRLGLNER